MTTTELWTTLAERNAFIPPSKVVMPAKAAADAGQDAIYERLVARVVPDLPGPLPPVLFDPPSARAAGLLVACALARLHPANPAGHRMVDAAAAVPSPQTPAQHVTQAAILWHAVPLAKRMQSDAFRALNRGDQAAESKEAAGEFLTAFLARRPLLSFRHDCEEFFSHAAPPPLEGFREGLGLRRWLVQRLASALPGDGHLPRRAAVLRQLEDSDLRDLLVLLDRGPEPAPLLLLAELLPLIPRGQWPEDLAPALRARALSLRKPPEEETDERDEPHV